MIKKIYRIIVLSLLILGILLINNNYATTTNQNARITQVSSFSEMKGAADDFINAGKNDQKINAQTAKEKILPIANMLVGIATVVFLIVGGILGLQYMLNGANERAQLKQKLIWFVIAVVVVYGATGIFNIAVNIMTTITGE